MMDTLLVQLQAFLTGNEGPRRRRILRELLAEDTVLDDGQAVFRGPRLVNLVSAFDQVEILTAYRDGAGAALLFEAFNGRTARFERCSWFIAERDGRIARILAAQVPTRPAEERTLHAGHHPADPEYLIEHFGFRTPSAEEDARGLSLAEARRAVIENLGEPPSRGAPRCVFHSLFTRSSCCPP